MTNRELCDQYPFLIPRNSWSGKKITDGAGFWPGSPDKVPEYDFEYTEFDTIPKGWRKAFGMQLCEELRQQLIQDRYLDDFYFVQIKEKFGSLRLYPNACPEGVYKILNKYEKMSKRICIQCGKPATRITTGWICPYCDDCCPSHITSVPIEEWLNSSEE